jgi:hypothetical protein
MIETRVMERELGGERGILVRACQGGGAHLTEDAALPMLENPRLHTRIFRSRGRSPTEVSVFIPAFGP